MPVSRQVNSEQLKAVRIELFEHRAEVIELRPQRVQQHDRPAGADPQTAELGPRHLQGPQPFPNAYRHAGGEVLVSSRHQLF